MQEGEAAQSASKLLQNLVGRGIGQQLHRQSTLSNASDAGLGADEI